jgi:hypothetical protein
MTPDQRALAVWGGGGGACVILGCVVLFMRGGTLSELIPRATALHAGYTKLYHPDRPTDGVPAAEALQEAMRTKERQESELRRAEAVLVPELPKPYVATGVNAGSATIHADHAMMRSRSQSQSIPLPATLPLDGGLDKDEAKQAIQLAQLYLYRAVVDQCFDAGVSKITAITPGGSEADPSGSYLILTCDFDIEASYEAGQQLLQNLLQAHKSGIGVKAVGIDQAREGKQKLKVTASLLTANRFGVKPSEAPRAVAPKAAPVAAPTPAPAPDAPVKASPPRGRLGG